jgi:UDP-N-acetylmuramoyl-L-alanine---L-glutamate ligase
MRPTISWSDLPGHRVALYGLGQEGYANLRKCQELGLDPVLVDDNPPAAGSDDRRAGGRPVLATASGGLAALYRSDVVIKTPGISRYGAPIIDLEQRGVLVAGGLGLWLQEVDRRRVLCVTGTKGKSTTTAIAGHLLNNLGYRCLVGGNIGVPPYDPVNTRDASYDYWVIEVSSYQATDLASSPPQVAVTSLSPDHLPWHRSDTETYFRDKLSACSRPGADLTIADGDSDLLWAHKELLGPRVQWIHADDEPASDWMESLDLLGAHNRRNALIASAGLSALGVPEADDAAALAEAARGFQHLESRLRPVATIDGVTFVDDSLSTNVLPTLAAVDVFPDRRVALIVGGHDRNIDYQPLAEGLRKRGTETLVLTVPDNGPLIRSVIEQAGTGDAITAVDCDDLAQAVRQGFEWARPGGVVLLSPAAASFGHFRNYRERGDAFAVAARSCASATPS